MYEALGSMLGTDRQTWKCCQGTRMGKGKPRLSGLNLLRCPGDLAYSLFPLCGRKNWSETRESLGLWSSLPTGLMIASPLLPSTLTCPSSEYAQWGLSETEMLLSFVLKFHIPKVVSLFLFFFFLFLLFLPRYLYFNFPRSSPLFFSLLSTIYFLQVQLFRAKFWEGRCWTLHRC